MVLKLLCCCVFSSTKKKLPMFFFGKDGGSHVEHPTCPWGSLACPPPQPPQVSSIVCLYRYAYVYYINIYILEYILVGILRCQVFLIFSDGKLRTLRSSGWQLVIRLELYGFTRPRCTAKASSHVGKAAHDPRTPQDLRCVKGRT